MAEIRYVGLTGVQMLLLSEALDKAYPDGHEVHPLGESCNVCLLRSVFVCAGRRTINADEAQRDADGRQQADRRRAGSDRRQKEAKEAASQTDEEGSQVP